MKGIKILCIVLAIINACTCNKEIQQVNEGIVMSSSAKMTEGIRDDVCGDNVHWSISDDRILTIQGSGDMYNYSSTTDAPWHDKAASLKKIEVKLGVLSIGDYAFCSTSATQITIPSSVVRIGKAAMYGCMYITDLYIPASVTSIGASPFYACRQLQSFEVDSNNPKYTSNDGVLIDKQSQALVAYPPGNTSTSYSIPQGILKLGESSFATCSHLTEVIVPEGVEMMDQMSFFLCNAMTSISLPSSLTSIGYSAFRHCSQLKTITIPESVTSVGTNAFESCSQLKSVYYQGSTTIATSNLFKDCGSLDSVCVSPDYNSTTFGGTNVTLNEETCVSFRNKFNHCYKGAFDKNGELVSEKRRNATEWESQSNHCYLYECVDTAGPQSGKRPNATQWESQSNYCYEYQCINSSGGNMRKRDNATEWEKRTSECIEYKCNNASGFLSWSMCNSTGGLNRTCVDGKCVDGVPFNDKPWSVAIEIDGVKATDLNIEELIDRINNLTGISKDEIELGITVDEKGFVISIIVYVDTEERAKIISDALDIVKKGEGCKYGVLCRAKRIRINRNEGLDISGLFHTTINAIYLVILVITMLFN